MNSFRSQLKFLLVQGRAIPQIGEHIQYFPSNWKEEFPLIRPLGLSGIEWIYDKKSEEYEFSDDKKKELENVLVSKLRQGQLNKLSEIVYDPTIQKITEIKKLKFENNGFSF